MINETGKKNEIRSENMSQLHRSITTELQRRLRDTEMNVKSRDAEIERLNQQVEVQQHTKCRAQVGRSRGQASARDPALDLTAAQWRIAQQEVSILSLNHALTVRRGELEESASESAQAAAAERSAPEGALFAGGLDLETQPMQLLADQLARLKLEYTGDEQQLKTAKTTEASLTTKVASLERYRKSLEDSLEAHQQRYEIMEPTYQKKIDVLAQTPASPEAANAANETAQADFQAEVARVREQARAQ
jgi:chromosome segregation ATPase